MITFCLLHVLKSTLKIKNHKCDKIGTTGSQRIVFANTVYQGFLTRLTT